MNGTDFSQFPELAAAINQIDRRLLDTTGKPLGDLQKTILIQVWAGRKYSEIADSYHCTEGHVKDMSSDLWKLLSQVLAIKISKNNLRSALQQQFPIPAKESSPNFIGRATALEHLQQLAERGVRAIIIQGEGGLGKTTLAQQFFQQGHFDCILELMVAKEVQHLVPADRIVEEWLRQDFQQDPSHEFGVSLSRLKRQLQGQRVGVLIDNLEPALDRQGQFVAPHRSYVELLRILTDPQIRSTTLITSRDRLCEASLEITHYRLPGLTLTAWQQFFTNHHLTPEVNQLATLHHAYGGNAKAMNLLVGHIQEDYDGQVTNYWDIHGADLLVTTDLKNLVASQVDRLQTLDPSAYRLFCRLGCYRYQEIATIPAAGVTALLWDIDPAEHSTTILALRNRSLVEYRQGYYWLHPVLRQEAITRLRRGDNWVIANHQAGQFWTASITQIHNISDALQALEAYYHYAAIDDYDAASKVILKSRNNQWQQYLPLGSTLHRMGLVQPVLTAITQILEHSPTNQHLSELNNILGDLRWITGNIQGAIACQEKTIALAQAALVATVPPQQSYYLKMLEVDSLLSIGLYKIDLWELDAAAELFHKTIQLSENTAHHAWAEKAAIGLSLVQSHLGCTTVAAELAERSYQNLARTQLPRFAYFLQLLGQTYINFGHWERAQELFEKAGQFAEAGHYQQIKARTLMGLATIDVQQSGCLDSAASRYQEAIQTLESIGAKCDLAEAWLQLGMLQGLEMAFDRAEQLFTEIQAPQQVARLQIARSASS